MDKDALIAILEDLKNRLDSDVREAAYRDNGSGQERLNSWLRTAKKKLDPFSPKIYKELKNKPLPQMIFFGNEQGRSFDDYKRTPILAYINSLITDIQNDEIDFENELEKQLPKNEVSEPEELSRKAFIVHGHDHALKHELARVLKDLDFEPVILSEKANSGQTVIEKLLRETDVGFAVVLYTPDDMGEATANRDNLKPRARQNVVFEHGLLIGKLGRERVFTLVADNSNIELPSDIQGIVYMSSGEWKFALAREIKAANFEVDSNKLF